MLRVGEAVAAPTAAAAAAAAASSQSRRLPARSAAACSWLCSSNCAWSPLQGSKGGCTSASRPLLMPVPPTDRGVGMSRAWHVPLRAQPGTRGTRGLHDPILSWSARWSCCLRCAQGGVHICTADQAPELAKRMLGQTLVTKQTGPAGALAADGARARTWAGLARAPCAHTPFQRMIAGGAAYATTCSCRLRSAIHGRFPSHAPACIPCAALASSPTSQLPLLTPSVRCSMTVQHRQAGERGVHCTQDEAGA
jgi:hypothetical protein